VRDNSHITVEPILLSVTDRACDRLRFECTNGPTPMTQTPIMKRRLTRIVPSLGTAVILSASAYGQEATPAEGRESTPPEKPEAPAAPAAPVSGTFSLDVNTHFISYGQDVWSAGTRWDNPTFNPSLELTIAGPKDLKFIVGTWWDMNDNAVTSIGDKKIQEVDVWAGASYTIDKVTVKALYQEWMYAGDSERIVDLIVSAGVFLNPSLTIHSRIDGNGTQGRGVVAVLGISHTLPAGPVSLSFPLNVAFASGNYFGGTGGYAFTSVGANASLPLKFLPGSWSLNAGVTGYHTREEVYPTNPDEFFATGKIGLTLTF